MTERTERGPIRPDAPTVSTEHQEQGDAARPRDVLDREPKRDPESGQTIPDDYDPKRSGPARKGG